MVTIALAAVGALLLSMFVVVVIGNDFRFTQRAVTIPGPDGTLEGVLTSPEHGSARGLVVMVHGDGPVEATQDGLYHSWFEGAADAGFATLSWSKPGVAGSQGDWLDQTMGDRAAEVSAAIDWAESNPEIPTQRIVLWGASQAGWVVPEVTRARDDVDAVVAVGPAINWLRQGRFDLDTDLDDTGADDEERRGSIAASDQTRDLLERGASYETYRAETIDPEPMAEGRWTFVSKNYTADATADLTASATRRIPVHLMVGTHDRNVDVQESEATYRTIFGSDLSVTHVDGSHSLARPLMENNEGVGWATALLWPRALFAPGAIDDYTGFLTRLDP